MSRAERMRPVVERWKSSGLSLLAFSKREAISYSKLQYWVAKLGASQAAPKKSRSAELAPVHVVPEESATPAMLSVWLTNGVALEVPAGFAEDELRRLVGILSTC